MAMEMAQRRRGPFAIGEEMEEEIAENFLASVHGRSNG
jgi:hypothetical protein